MIILEGNLDGLLLFILAIMFGPALLLAIVGFAIMKTQKKVAKTLFILSVLYVIISLGICGGMIL